MITITDAIPNLAQLNQVVTSIRAAINESVDVLNGGSSPEFWIAGGAITAAMAGTKINDYDVFSPDPEAVFSHLKQANVPCSFENEFFANFWIDNKKIQVIRRYQPQDPQAIFATFDFTIVCGAYDGSTFYCHDRFFQDIATKRLVVNTLFFPLRTMERATKYAMRGYTPCPIGLLMIAKEIHGLTIDWDNPNENHLSFYPDGTPRFNGPD